MSHEFESGVFANRPAWHGLGVVHMEAEHGKLHADEALRKGGLDWRVSKEPVVRKGEPVEAGEPVVELVVEKVEE